MAAILSFIFFGCGDETSSMPSKTVQYVLIKLQYADGQIAPEFIPKLQILETGEAHLVAREESKETQLSDAQFKTLLTKASNPNFLTLDSAKLQGSTQILMQEQGGPIPRIMDASTTTIRVWTGKSFHEVSFYAPRQYLRLSGDNPDLARFVDLLEELENVLSLFPNN